MKRRAFLSGLPALAALPAASLSARPPSPTEDELIRRLLDAPLVGIQVGWNNRGAVVAHCAVRGSVRLQERTNEETCPHCGHDWGVVYQWTPEIQAEFGHDPDGRWFCPCGFTEVPDGDELAWREAAALSSRWNNRIDFTWGHPDPWDAKL